MIISNSTLDDKNILEPKLALCQHLDISTKHFPEQQSWHPWINACISGWRCMIATSLTRTSSKARRICEGSLPLLSVVSLKIPHLMLGNLGYGHYKDNSDLWLSHLFNTGNPAPNFDGCIQGAGSSLAYSGQGTGAHGWAQSVQSCVRRWVTAALGSPEKQELATPQVINCRRELDVSYCKSAHRKKTEPASTDTSGLRGGQDGGERRALPLPKAGWAEGRAACQPSRAGRRGAQGRPGPGQAAPHAISARGAVSGPRSSGGQAGRQAGGSQGGGGPETPRGTAARVTELPRPRRPLARLRTATEAPANGRGGARARPSPAPRCGWWRPRSGCCSAAAVPPGPSPRPWPWPWRTGRSPPRSRGTAHCPGPDPRPGRHYRQRGQPHPTSIQTARSPPLRRLLPASRPAWLGPAHVSSGAAAYESKRGREGSLCHSEWLPELPSAHPFLTVNPPQSPLIGSGLGRGAKSLFYLATAAHRELPLAAGSATGPVGWAMCVRGPVAAAGSSRRLRLAAAASRLRAAAAAFRPWVVWGSGALRGAPSAGGLPEGTWRPGDPAVSRCEGSRGFWGRGGSAWPAGCCPSLGKKASV